MQTKYERDAYQFLSFYRFFTYALAIVFLQFTPSIAPRMPDLQVFIILGALGVYSLLKVFSPLRWREKGLMAYIILVGDFLVCVLLAIYTNGVNSAFLLYSLTPIMSAALLFEEKVSLSLAGAAAVFLVTPHLALSQLSDRFAWIMEGQQLTLLIIYAIFCIVIAIVPYRTNLNIRRRIEMEAIVEERRRIGREMHDSVAQSLGYLNLKTRMASNSVSSRNTEQSLAELDEIRQVVQNTYENVREAIDQLSAEPRSLPLIPTLAEYTRKFSEQTGIRVQFTVPKLFPPLSPVAELQLLRIAQEALTNVRRHASATEVAVKLESTAQTVAMVSKDNGRGFIPSEREKSPGYRGLSIMRERTEGLGGTLTIATAPGQGTEVRVSLPIEKVRL